MPHPARKLSGAFSLLALPLSLAHSPSLIASETAAVENRLVYYHPDEFAGWPANEGMWAWGDEMLVGFEVADYVATEDDHSIDRNSRKRIVFARSLDGGATWSPEYKDEIASPAYLEDRSLYDQSADDPTVLPSPGGIDFTADGFAMKLRGNTFYVSSDRGHTWEGPYQLPEFGYSGEARTSYIVTGPSSAVFFITLGMERDGVPYSRSCAIGTSDGARSFTFLGWIGDDIFDRTAPEERAPLREIGKLFSIMPSAVELGEGHYICAVRQRIDKQKWTDIFESTDGARTWTKVAVLEKGSSNPATLLKLDDGRIAAVYGSRRKPMGLAAKTSADGGRSWSDEITLRADARKWDLGYTRAVMRQDGKVVAVYYYTTDEFPENHIAATIWDPQPEIE